MINFLPLALGAFSPVGITLVIFLLTSQNGVRKTLAYLISETLAFAIWGVIFLHLSPEFAEPQVSDSTGVRETLRIFLGIILLVIAVRVLLTEQDPDALPLKWRSMVDRINAIALFFVNLFLSLIQLRFVILIMLGMDMIHSAQLPQVSVFISSLVLLIVLLWSQFVPLVVFLVYGKERELVLKNLEGWMTRNARHINSAFLGGLGLFLVLGS